VIEATGAGAGGVFWTPNDASVANLATTASGVEGFGPERGGLFGDTDQTSFAVVAGGDAGIGAIGHEMGGWFAQTELNSEAYVARGGAGINAFGEETGGYFQNTADQSAAHLGHNGRGVEGFGDGGGGYFEDTDEGTWGTVAQSTASFAGNGAKSFVQNHPYDATRVIVYTAQEGDEVGTYTRGTARLSGGEAWVELGETFQWVTNPDLGLTVHLTPVGSWSQLYVAERSTSRLLVRSAGGDPNALFDYVVMGLRIGFEEASVVQEKWCDAPIPSMVSVEERYRREPELREHTARARFEGMLLDTGEPTPLDLSATEALGEAVGRARPVQ
jgi:hypothetical protein